ncbi:MAG: hypothetical protein ACTH07_06560, partial [Microbacterium sp.]
VAAASARAGGVCTITEWSFGSVAGPAIAAIRSGSAATSATEGVRPAAWAAWVHIVGGPADGSFESRFDAAMSEHPDAKIHTYGKQARPGRKVGHVNAAGDDLDDVVYTARAAVDHFR